MKLKWLSPALVQLDAIHARLSQVNPRAAKAVFRQIRESATKLTRFPNIGRVGQVAGTQELVLGSLPYILVYRVKDDVVEILRVFHTAMDWPNALN